MAQFGQYTTVCISYKFCSTVLRFLENSFSSEYNPTLQQMYQGDVEVGLELCVHEQIFQNQMNLLKYRHTSQILVNTTEC